MSRFMRGLFQTAHTISTIDPTALLFAPGGHSPTGGVCCMVQRWNVCAIVFWRVVWYRAGTFLLCDHVRARRGRRGHVVAVAVSRPSWPWLPRPGRRGHRCGVRRLCVAVVWLRHADEC